MTGLAIGTVKKEGAICRINCNGKNSACTPSRTHHPGDYQPAQVATPCLLPQTTRATGIEGNTKQRHSQPIINI